MDVVKIGHRLQCRRPPDDLVYDLEHSALLRHPAGGPFIYLVKRPETQNLEVLPIVAIEDSTTFTHLPPVPSSVGSSRLGFGRAAEDLDVAPHDLVDG